MSTKQERWYGRLTDIGFPWSTTILVVSLVFFPCCFAPRLPDDEPEPAFELTIEAGENPREIRFTWALPPSLREDVDSFRLEWDLAGSGAFVGVPGFDSIPSSQSQAIESLPIHLVPWSVAQWRIAALTDRGVAIRTSEPLNVSGASVGAGATGFFKASNPGADDSFGSAVAVAGDGRTLAVGAGLEDSGSRRVNGVQDDESAVDSGAVYLFREAEGRWLQDAYLKASNPGVVAGFGSYISLSDEGEVLAIGATGERGLSQGINGDQTLDGEAEVGAVYLFERTDLGWSQVAYLKPSNTSDGQSFNFGSLALSGDGRTLVVGASAESSGSRGVEGDQGVFDALESGAVYVFETSGTSWRQTAYLKSSNADSGDRFGFNVALSSDGQTLAVAAPGESSQAGADADNNEFLEAGAVYVFQLQSGVWSEVAFIKASNAEAGDRFGAGLALSGDGETLAVGSEEDSGSFGIDGDPSNNSAEDSGAIYVFVQEGAVWMQEAYLKPSSGEAGDLFGRSLGLSFTGDRLSVGAPGQDEGGPGVDVDRAETRFADSGAAYVFQRQQSVWSEVNFVKASNPGPDDRFGTSVSVSSNGEVLAVGSTGEDSSVAGIDGDGNDNSSVDAGAVYVY
ncbi:MAG: integrin [Myxococcota bacterium]